MLRLDPERLCRLRGQHQVVVIEEQTRDERGGLDTPDFERPNVTVIEPDQLGTGRPGRVGTDTARSQDDEDRRAASQGEGDPPLGVAGRKPLLREGELVVTGLHALIIDAFLARGKAS
jgi:hypothetical protein